MMTIACGAHQPSKLAHIAAIIMEFQPQALASHVEFRIANNAIRIPQDAQSVRRILGFPTSFLLHLNLVRFVKPATVKWLTV